MNTETVNPTTPDYPAAWMQDIPRAIEQAKVFLRSEVPNLKARFAALEDTIRSEIKAVKAEAAAGGAVPEIEFSTLASLSEAERARIRRRGCVVVRNVFPQAQVAAWNDEVAAYIERNDYEEKSKSRVGLDKYFSALASSKPQIFSLYWSKPQIAARQHENLAATRRWLNHLWNDRDGGTQVFDPDRECSYADRVRRRAPGAVSLGLSPHADGGSVERWCDPSFHRVYHDVLFGDVSAYNPFNAAGRTQTLEIPSPAVASVFRTYQGWTALSTQGPGDGTLKLVPITKAMGWMLLRALQDDVPADNLCDAAPGRALSASARWHGMLLEAEVSIPVVNQGDTVWWHPDLIHAVEDQHRGKGFSNVMYIGAAPYCEKNQAFLKKQKAAFMAGRSCPDFAPEDYEVDFTGRATEADLSELGLRQMGLKPW